MFALPGWIRYEFPMKRRYLYMLYAALWVLTLWLFYGLRPQGSGPLWTLFLYGPPVFVLYLFSLFLLNIREGVVDRSMVARFLRRRRLPIGLFFLGLVVLILLIFK